jgi:hypothetical protein
MKVLHLVNQIRQTEVKYCTKQKNHSPLSPLPQSERRTNLQNAHSYFTFFQNSKPYVEYPLLLSGTIICYHHKICEGVKVT